MKFLKLFYDPTNKLESAGMLIFLLLTVMSIIFKHVTVFYIIYLFWCSEVVRSTIDVILSKKPSPETIASPEGKLGIGPRFFMLGIYFVFIIVFFGFIANSNNDLAMLINFEVFFFQNIFFNLSLMFVIIERIVFHRANRDLEPSYHTFTANMIVLHISIILGGMIIFFLVFKFEKTFSPENLWGSVLMISPFLLLRLIIRGEE